MTWPFQMQINCFQAPWKTMGARNGSILLGTSGTASAFQVFLRMLLPKNIWSGARNTDTFSLVQNRTRSMPVPLIPLLFRNRPPQNSLSSNRSLNWKPYLSQLLHSGRKCFDSLSSFLNLTPWWKCTASALLSPQLMAEIGDVRRFSSKKSLIAFAGIEPQPNDSGKVVGNDKGISKVGSAVLRRTLFLIMTVILQTQPQDEPVFSSWTKSAQRESPTKFTWWLRPTSSYESTTLKWKL